MSTEREFDFDGLNRKPKSIIALAVEEYRAKYPNKALNRYGICYLLSLRLEAKYLPKKDDDCFIKDDDDKAIVNDEATDMDNSNDSTESEEDENPEGQPKKKKEYNGRHNLTKMNLDTTGKLLDRIDYYIYRYY